MIIKNEKGLTILEATEGKWLTNGDTYSQRVFLGKNGSPADWREVDSPDTDPELTAEEALKIIMGGNA